MTLTMSPSRYTSESRIDFLPDVADRRCRGVGVAAGGAAGTGEDDLRGEIGSACIVLLPCAFVETSSLEAA